MPTRWTVVTVVGERGYDAGREMRMVISVSSMGWEAVSSWARWEILTVSGVSSEVLAWMGSQVETEESSCLMTVGEICE